MSTARPRAKASELEVRTLDGKTWTLSEQDPVNYTMVVFYRGLHCPVCKTYLGELDSKVEAFNERGTDVIAVSCDTRERAQQTVKRWGIKHLTIAYGLSTERAQEWGLYISKAIKDDEPDRFCEPGFMLINPDGTLYAAAIQSMPFARPHFKEILAAIDFVVENNYPARGEAAE